jgi:hypothetical protein
MKINFLVKYNHLLFSLTLSGYGLVSYLVTNAEASRQITVPYRIVILALNLLYIFSILLASKQRKSDTKNGLSVLWHSWISQLLLSFLVLYSFRLIYDISIRNIASLLEPSQYLFFWFLITLLPGLSFLFLDYSIPSKYLRSTWISYFVIALLAIPASLNTDLASTQGRLSGEALNSITLGHYGVSLVLLSTYLFLNFQYEIWGSAEKILRLIYPLAALLGCLIVFLSSSRGPIVALSICLPLVLIGSRKINIRLLIILMSLFFGSIWASSFALGSGSSFLDRFSTISDEIGEEEVGASMSRGGLARLAFQLFLDNPIIGFGVEIPNGGYPHNIVLEAFMALGLIGGTIFMLIVLGASRKALLMVLHSNHQWGWLGIIFIQYLIAVMFSGNLYSSDTFWYLLFAVVGVRKSIYLK